MVADLEGDLMDWNKATFLLAQTVTVIVLGVMVCLGHDSAVTDGLLAVVGSVAGVSVYETVRKRK
jgi:hypothetical protein